MFIVEKFNIDTNVQYLEKNSCQLNNHSVMFQAAQAGVVGVWSDGLTCGVALNNR